jgi:hypothetical protein
MKNQKLVLLILVAVLLLKELLLNLLILQHMLKVFKHTHTDNILTLRDLVQKQDMLLTQKEGTLKRVV